MDADLMRPVGNGARAIQGNADDLGLLRHSDQRIPQ